MTRAALLVHFQLDRYFAAAGRCPERNLETRFDILSALRSRRTRTLVSRISENRAEQIAESAKTSDVEVLEVVIWIRAGTRRTARRRPATR
jgi:hypothetical protein